METCLVIRKKITNHGNVSIVRSRDTTRLYQSCLENSWTMISLYGWKNCSYQNSLYAATRKTKWGRTFCKRTILVTSKLTVRLRRCSRLFERLEIINLPPFLIINSVSLKQQYNTRYNWFLVGNCLAKRNFKSSTECAPYSGYRIVFTKVGFRSKSPGFVLHHRCNWALS